MTALKAIILAVLCLAFIGSSTCEEIEERGECDPRDDCSGHVTGCADDGTKECMDGWTGEHCMTKESETQELCSDITPPLYCTGGTCFDGACCCSTTRDGEYCLNGENVDDPCDPDPCNGHLCVRAPFNATFDVYCDIPSETPTTTQSATENGSSDIKSTVFLLMIICSLMALLVC